MEIDAEILHALRAKYCHIPTEILNNAANRYVQAGVVSNNTVQLGFVDVDIYFVGELADQFYRYGYTEELAEIIGGQWGLLTIGSIVGRIEKIAGKIKQSKSEHKLASTGPAKLRQKFRKSLRKMTDEIPSMRGIACAILYMAQNGAVHLFPTEIIAERKSGLSTEKWPILFKAYCPLQKDFCLFSAEITTDSLERFSKIVEHNNEHQSNPDMLQGVTLNVDIEKNVSPVWNSFDLVRPASSIGQSIKVTYSNSVLSAFRAAVYRYVRLEFGRAKDKVESDAWEKESRGWMTGYLKHEHERAIEIPFLAISKIQEECRLTNLESQILHEIDQLRISVSNNADFNDENFKPGSILHRLNSKENTRKIPKRSFYYAYNSLLEKANSVLLKRDED